MKTFQHGGEGKTVEFDTHEEQQIEAIKKWWKDNGAAVIMGVALGFALLLGWRYWQDHTWKQAEQGSGHYERVRHLVLEGKSEDARNAAQNLLAEQPGSAYAALTSLLLAQRDIEEEQTEAGAVRLQWVIDNAKLPELVHIARLRKARLELAKADDAAALALIKGIEPGTFKAAYEELQGDIFLAQQQTDAAKTAYSNALADESISGQKSISGQRRTWLQMKYDDLGASPATTGLPLPAGLISEFAQADTLSSPPVSE
ncbi:MAG: tetratricopeptide repeat protein [Gammaproteobacteria bacterium]|nr:tetratricopeptide repeat protein [Gammaproteobacteria bacterium]